MGREFERVFVITPRCFGGGGDIAALLLKKNIQGIKLVSYYCRKEDFEFVDYCLNLGLSIKGFGKFLNITKKLVKIYSFIKNLPYHSILLIYEQGIFFYFYLIAKITRRKDLKLILWIQTSFSKELENEDWLGYIYKSLNVYKKANFYIPVSKYVWSDFVKNFLEKETNNYQVIYNPVDIERVEKLSNEEIASQDKHIFNRPVILNIGRYTLQKNQKLLIKAFSILHEKYDTDANLVILSGGGDDLIHEELIKLAKKLNINDRVFFLSHRANPYPYIKKAKIFTLTSIYEGTPLALLESMALGTPCVCTNFGGVREILGKNQYGIITSFDEEEVADAIFKLLQNEKLYDDISVRAKERAKDFSVDIFVKNFKTVLMSI